MSNPCKAHTCGTQINLKLQTKIKIRRIISACLGGYFACQCQFTSFKTHSINIYYQKTIGRADRQTLIPLLKNNRATLQISNVILGMFFKNHFFMICNLSSVNRKNFIEAKLIYISETLWGKMIFKINCMGRVQFFSGQRLLRGDSQYFQ